MSAALQRLVDDLAERLRRSVAVDDPDIQLLAASPHHGAIDQVRMDVILSRRTPALVLEFVQTLQLPRARGPRRVVGDASLQILPRLVVPLRDHDELYGYLWLIDEPAVTDADLALTVEAAVPMARLLAAEAQANDERSAEDARVVRTLLGGPGPERDAAMARVEASGQLHPGRPWRVAVLGVAAGADTPTPVYSAARLMRSVLGPTLAAPLDDGEFAVVTEDPEWQPATARTPVRPVWERLRVALGSRGITLDRVGVAQQSVGEPLGLTAERARFCRDMAGRLPRRPPVVHWEELGGWQLLYGLPWSRETVAALHPGIEQLLDPEHHELAVTLATWLDSGGDSAATVEALHVHRATLYYRRDRIRSLIGTDWEHGWGRVGASAAMVLAGMLDPRVAALPTARAPR